MGKKYHFIIRFEMTEGRRYACNILKVKTESRKNFMTFFREIVVFKFNTFRQIITKPVQLVFFVKSIHNQ